MKPKKKKLMYMQPITRVHNIYRIRTVINEVTKMNERGIYPHDIQIGTALAKLGLSKYRKDEVDKIKDRIMRRARDHLLTATYMGFLTRKGRPLLYSSTTAGKLLKAYKWREECPKDESEEAIFIDRLMRLKLTNVFDRQTGGQYKEFRSRPVLFVLYALNKQAWLHEHEVAIATGGMKSDPFLMDQLSRSLLRRATKYVVASKKSLSQFYNDFDIKTGDKKNMTRNIRPILDWCEALGLVISKEVDKTEGRWWSITDRGREVLGIYERKLPIWFHELAPFATTKAALLLLLQYVRDRKLVIDRGFLRSKIQVGLTMIRIQEIYKGLAKNGIRFKNGTLEMDLDFMLEYDVPAEQMEEVLLYIKKLSTTARLVPYKVIKYIKEPLMQGLLEILKHQNEIFHDEETAKFTKSMAINPSDHLIGLIKRVVSTPSISAQYRSNFEKEAAILFKLIGVNAIKYQGQLAYRCHKSHVMRFFENNPDIIILNGVEVLVECKSNGEWPPPISGVKSVPKEIIIYQQYMLEVKPNSTIIMYEGSLDGKSKEYLKAILKDNDHVMFINKNFLLGCIGHPSLIKRLLREARGPNLYNAEERILVS